MQRKQSLVWNETWNFIPLRHKGMDFFAENPNFIIPKSQQPDDANLSYFKLKLFDPPEFIVWNIYGLQHLVLKKLRFKNPRCGKDSITLA